MTEIELKDKRFLGASKIEVSSIGIGTWAWGDQGMWQYGKNFTRYDIDEAFKTSLAAGVNFFDTAEVYGKGESERIVGQLLKYYNSKVVIASKFAPLPYRLNAAELEKALDSSLFRLGLDQLDLYQIHWPYTLLRQSDLMKALAKVVKAGKVKAVGVSNYNAAQTRKAHRLLAGYGVPLASNQVLYNLAHRKPETNGVLQTCRELNVAVIAYSPLAQGVLTGKYMGANAQKVGGMRRFMPSFRSGGSVELQSLVTQVKAVAQEKGKTPSQVALNWLMCKDELVIPIPGAKNQKQAEQNTGALGWRLSAEEVARLDEASRPFLK